MPEHIPDGESASTSDFHRLCSVLEGGGFYMRIHDDMHRLSAALIHRERYVYPGFRWLYEGQERSRWIGIYNGADQLQTTIAWRIFDTEDLVSAVSSFLPRYCDHGCDESWSASVAGEVKIAGRIGYRGAINSFTSGKRLAWFAATGAMMHLMGDGVDYQAAEAREDIANSALLGPLYGYPNKVLLGPIEIKRKGASERLTLLWSNRAQMAEEIDKRAALLRNCDPHDFDAFIGGLYSKK